jgi:hypothetical protein
VKAERQTASLPEVVFLRDFRGERPENAVGIGEFWYEPGIWSLPLSPAAKVLYAGLCSFLGHGEIHRKDLRATLKDSSDEGIAEALEELVRHKLLEPASEASPSGYAIRAIG